MNSLHLVLCFLISFSWNLAGSDLQRLKYNHPGLMVDLGVGLWAWPLPMDFNDNGLTDLLVVCTDMPSNGVYFFENSGRLDGDSGLPVFKPAVRLGPPWTIHKFPMWTANQW